MKKIAVSVFTLCVVLSLVFVQAHHAVESSHPSTARKIKSPTSGLASAAMYAIRSTSASTSISNSDELVSVARVIDGDTIVVSLNGNEDTVRLIGIDTPEIVDPRKPVQCFGREASDETKTLLTGQSVYLGSDTTQSNRDKYGRLLRYVFLPDGTNVDTLLVEQGFAREYTYENKPYQLQKEFKQAQSDAQVQNRGLWGECHWDTI